MTSTIISALTARAARALQGSFSHGPGRSSAISESESRAEAALLERHRLGLGKHSRDSVSQCTAASVSWPAWTARRRPGHASDGGPRLLPAVHARRPT